MTVATDETPEILLRHHLKKLKLLLSECSIRLPARGQRCYASMRRSPASARQRMSITFVTLHA